MTVEMIDKMELTLDEWLEILRLCELLFNGLCETYCQKKKAEQQLRPLEHGLEKLKNFCYNISTERQKEDSVAIDRGGVLLYLAPASINFFKKFLQNQINHLL